MQCGICDGYRDSLLCGIGGAVASLLISYVLLELTGDISVRSWQQTLREAGVSAHEVAKIEKYDAGRQKFYFEQFWLNRQDGMDVAEAHRQAIERADNSKWHER